MFNPYGLVVTGIVLGVFTIIIKVLADDNTINHFCDDCGMPVDTLYDMTADKCDNCYGRNK